MVLGIEQVEQGVKKKRQEVEGGQERGERRRPMPEVVFQVIALGFEGSVVFILDFPARAACLDDGRNGFGGERGLGHEGVVVERRPRSMREREVTPIDVERVRARP